MIIELVTPLMLATSPQIVDMKVPVYSHESQQTVALLDGEDKNKVSRSSTQTFDATGKPWDADYD